MISIKDYAGDSGVSYEAVRRQIKRYSEELDGHIRTEGRTQYLDEVAVAFLDSHRAKAPLAIGDVETERELEYYKKQAEEYRTKYEKAMELANMVMQENQTMLAAKVQLELADQKYALLEENRDELKDRAEKLQNTVEELKEEKAAAAKAAEEQLQLKEKEFQDQITDLKKLHERELAAEQKRKLKLADVKRFFRGRH